MTIFFQLYTFVTISNYQSHGKTIIIIRIIMLFYARQGANICRSDYNHYKNSWSNKPLRVIRIFINSVNWLSVQWNNVVESLLNRKKGSNTSIRLYIIRNYKNSRKWRSVILQFGGTQQYSAEDFSVIRRDGQFIYRPNAMFPSNATQGDL